MYLITGGAGFIGSKLVMHWWLAALEVVGMMKEVASLMWRSGTEAIERIERGLRRHGLCGSVRLVASLAGKLAGRLLYLHQRHIWYELDLDRERPLIALPPELELVRGSMDDLPLLEQLPTISLIEARRRLASGAEPRILRKGQQAVFSCWIFHDGMPVFAARRGWIDLPRGVVGLEDVVTSPSYLGQAIASGALSTIAGALRREGMTAILTKTEESNGPCRGALEKVGFQAAAYMSLVRVATRPRVEIQPVFARDVFEFLVAQLSR